LTFDSISAIINPLIPLPEFPPRQGGVGEWHSGTSPQKGRIQFGPHGFYPWGSRKMARKILYSLAIGLFLVGCGSKKEKAVSLSQGSPSEKIENSSAPLQKISTFSLEGYAQGGKKRWQVEGESADVLEDVVKLDKVVAETYTDQGKVDLKSDKGEYDKKNGKVHLEDNVVVTTSEGVKLTTERLTWDAQKEQVSTDKEVVIEKENLIAQGKGALAFPQTKKVKLNEAVRVEIKPATTITCSGPLDLDYGKNIAIFYDNVEVEDERGRILADKIEVYFEPQTRRIDRIFAYGNVRIMQAENTAYADEAVYNSISGKVTLKGNPKLVIYPESKSQ